MDHMSVIAAKTKASSWITLNEGPAGWRAMFPNE